ncbi:MAG: hypothetical protein ACKOKC_14590 [Chthoniobacterales bacterium]
MTALSVGNKFNINLWSLSGIGPDTNGSALFFTNTSSYTWTILTASNGITGFSAEKFNINTAAFNGAGGFANAVGGGAFYMMQNGNALDLVFDPNGAPQVIPNPAPGPRARCFSAVQVSPAGANARRFPEFYFSLPLQSLRRKFINLRANFLPVSSSRCREPSLRLVLRRNRALWRFVLPRCRVGLGAGKQSHRHALGSQKFQ